MASVMRSPLDGQCSKKEARLLMRPSRFLDELPTSPSPYEKWSIELAPEVNLLEE